MAQSGQKNLSNQTLKPIPFGDNQARQADKNWYNDIVVAATSAATLATLKALQGGAYIQPLGAPAPHDPSSSAGNEKETGYLAPFRFPAPEGKRRVPCPNEIKLIDGAMRKFLESESVLPTKDYTPDEPGQVQLKTYEEVGLMGLYHSAPRVCLTQTFKEKWNKKVVEILMTKFISAVKQGTYKPVQHTWSEMEEDSHTCLKGAKMDKVNRKYQRRQE
ncbi:hypothetical protein EI94DRAFT_1711048, partial [Lactarius quietus]